MVKANLGPVAAAWIVGIMELVIESCLTAFFGFFLLVIFLVFFSIVFPVFGSRFLYFVMARNHNEEDYVIILLVLTAPSHSPRCVPAISRTGPRFAFVTNRVIQDVNDRVVRLCRELLMAVHALYISHHTTCTVFLLFSGGMPNPSRRVACVVWCRLLHTPLLQATSRLYQ